MHLYIIQLKNKRIRVLLLAALSFLYFLRVIYLDADVPPWGVVAYQPIDEGIYNTMALNLYNYGCVDPNDVLGGNWFQMGAQDIVTVLPNMFVYLGMVLFGDNYFGFRMGSVFAGYLVVVLTYVLTVRLVGKIDQTSEYKYVAGVASVLLLLVSFQFYNATRIEEPSIYRTLVLLAVMVLYTDLENGIEIKSFLIGFIAIASIFFVYTTNVFIGVVLIGFLIYLFMTGRKRECGTHLVYGLFGALVAYVVAIAYYACWGVSPMVNLLSSIGAFSNLNSSGVGASYQLGVISNVVGNVVDFFTSNLSLYMLPVVALFTALAPTLFTEVISGIKDDLVRIILLVGGFLLQTSFASDFIVRKQIILIPYLVALVIVQLCSLKYISVQKRTIKQVGIFSAVSIIYVLFILWYRLLYVENQVVTKSDYSANAIIFLMLCGLISVILISIGTSLLFRGMSREARFYPVFLLFLFTAMNMGLTANYNISDRSFSEKEAMEAIGNDAGDNIVCGDYVMGFTLYNDIKPVKNDRNKLLPLLGMSDEYFFFDYENAMNFSKTPIDTWQTLETVNVYSREFRNSMAGPTRNVALYKSTYLSQLEE